MSFRSALRPAREPTEAERGSLRICKIMPSFPTRENPGAGLTGFRPSCGIVEPTCYITPVSDQSAELVPAHITLARLDLLTKALQWNRSSTGLLKRIRQLVFLAEFGWRSLPVAMKYQPDVTIIGISQLPTGLVLRCLTGCKLALTLHNMTEVEFITRHNWLGWLTAYVDLVFVVSPVMQEVLQDTMPNVKIVVRPTGIDLGLFRATGNKRRRQIITVGSFKWKKGYSHLLRAMRSLIDDFPDYSLLIVGDGPEKNTIHREIETLGLQRHVHLLGKLPQTELVCLLNQSRLFVLASLREGLPKALLEALACGTPAVVTDACNAGGFIRDVGLEVPSGDAEALATAMARLIVDRGLWNRCSARAPLVAESFSWERVASIEEEALRGLLRR